jgi:transposase
MAKPIPSEKRADIIRHMQSGKSKADVAVWLFVCVRTITRIWDKYTRLGSYEPEPQRSGRKALVSDETMDRVMAKIRETPDMTLLELIDEFNLQISQAALSKRLIKLGLTYKKRRFIQKTGNAKMSSKRGKSGVQSRTK